MYRALFCVKCQYQIGEYDSEGFYLEPGENKNGACLRSIVRYLNDVQWNWGHMSLDRRKVNGMKGR